MGLVNRGAGLASSFTLYILGIHGFRLLHHFFIQLLSKIKDINGYYGTFSYKEICYTKCCCLGFQKGPSPLISKSGHDFIGT